MYVQPATTCQSRQEAHRRKQDGFGRHQPGPRSGSAKWGGARALARPASDGSAQLVGRIQRLQQYAEVVHGVGVAGPSGLEEFDRRFPGFRSETHGVTIDPATGDHLIECIREP